MAEVGLRLEELDTPVLWVELDRLEQNIAQIAAQLGEAGVQWRPHIKGIKTPAIAHKLLDAGAIGVTCAKVSEAEVMAAAGIRNILIANQVVTPSKIARLVSLNRHRTVMTAVDNPVVVERIGAAAREVGVETGVVIEVDTGLHRSGVAPGEATLRLAKQIAATPGVRLRGLMTWEGHSLGLDDPAAKRASIEASICQVRESADLLRSHGLSCEIVSAGGSGTYTITAFLPGVTEVQAGGGIYCDQTYQKWGVPLSPALFVRTTVTSRPVPERLICDAGFKTTPRGFLPPKPVDFEAKSVVLSAEHGIILLADPSVAYQVGDSFDMLVGYSDATVCLHETLYGVRNGRVETAWRIQARGMLQ
jgi:D-serine deaminase-like pyridoxal phosphate-dependent protein